MPRPPPVASRKRFFSPRDASSVGFVSQNPASPQSPASPPPGSRSRGNARRRRKSPPAAPDGHGKLPNPNSTAEHSAPKRERPDWVDSIPAASETAHYSRPVAAAAIAARGPSQSNGSAPRISGPPTPT